MTSKELGNTARLEGAQWLRHRLGLKNLSSAYRAVRLGQVPYLRIGTAFPSYSRGGRRIRRRRAASTRPDIPRSKSEPMVASGTE